MEGPMPPEVLEAWHKEWQAAGYDRVAAAVLSPVFGPLIHDAGFGPATKRRVAEQWLKERQAERIRQLQPAEPDQRVARWHSWINTVVAVLALLTALFLEK